MAGTVHLGFSISSPTCHGQPPECCSTVATLCENQHVPAYRNSRPATVVTFPLICSAQEPIRPTPCLTPYIIALNENSNPDNRVCQMGRNLPSTCSVQ
jgi:hypothetical protein